MRGDKVGALHGVPIAMKDCFDFKRGLGHHLRRHPRPQELRRRHLLHVRRAHGAGRGDHGRQDQQPGVRLPRHLRQLHVRPVEEPLRPREEHRRLLRRQRRRGGGGAAAALRGHRRRRLDPHPRFLVRRLRLQAVVRARAVRGAGRTPSAAPRRSSSRARSPGPSRTPPWRCRSLAGYDSRDPYCVEGSVDFMAALRGSIAGKKIAYTRDYGIFPVDPRVIAVVDKAVEGLRGGGRPCRGGGDRHPPLAARAERSVVPLHRADAGRRAREASSARASTSSATIATTCRRSSGTGTRSGGR